MFYFFDLCLGFCALLVCIAYAYISTLHSGPRLYHHLLGIRMVVVTYPVAIWVEASVRILYLFTTLRCFVCFGFGMRWGTVYCALLLCAVYAYISTLHSAPRLSHQLFAVGMFAASYPIPTLFLRGPATQHLNNEARSAEFDGTDGTDGRTDGNQKCPSMFFILCGHLEHVYIYFNIY